MFYRLDSPWCGRISGLPYMYEDVVGEGGEIGGAAQLHGPVLVKCKPHFVSLGVVVGPPKAIVNLSEPYCPAAVDCSGQTATRQFALFGRCIPFRRGSAS